VDLYDQAALGADAATGKFETTTEEADGYTGLYLLRGIVINQADSPTSDDAPQGARSSSPGNGRSCRAHRPGRVILDTARTQRTAIHFTRERLP